MGANEPTTCASNLLTKASLKEKINIYFRSEKNKSIRYCKIISCAREGYDFHLVWI
jgi:hypothetical protein